MSRKIDRRPSARKPFNFLLSEEERAVLQAAADADQRTLGAWLRLAALAAARKNVRRRA